VGDFIRDDFESRSGSEILAVWNLRVDAFTEEFVAVDDTTIQ